MKINEFLTFCELRGDDVLTTERVHIHANPVLFCKTMLVSISSKDRSRLAKIEYREGMGTQVIEEARLTIRQKLGGNIVFHGIKFEELIRRFLED